MMYSQRDSKWSNNKLGTSNHTIGQSGCVITSICNLLLKHGYEITPDEANERIKNAGGYANGNLIIWSKLKDALPVEAYRYYGYDNNKVSQAIEDNKGCLVEASGARIGGSKHWTLFTGDGKSEDPWFGNVKTTSYYQPLTGYTIIKVNPKGGIMEQSDCEKQVEAMQKEIENANMHKTNLQQQVDGLLEDQKNLEIELAEEKDARKIDLQRIASKLATSDDIVEVLKEIEKLIVAEEGLTQCIDAKRECGEKYTAKATQYDLTFETLSLLSGIPVSTEKGVERAMQAYAKLHSKLPPSEITEYSFLVKLFGYLLYSRKEE